MPHGQFEAGEILSGRYRIVSLLGKGGMGEVYRADDLTLKQAVALKILPREIANRKPVLDALLNEARKARQVTHHHVCRMHDIGEVDGRPFLTMEFIEGEDLGSLLRRIGRLPEAKALQLGRQLCEGIQAVHAERVLHLDLKPANLMIDQRGDLRISDFGLAQLVIDARVERRVSGTPAYMAPEQLLRGEASERCDIYAIGLILYEMFTGRRAIQGKSLEEIRRFHQSGGLIEVPAELEILLVDCFAADPSARPAGVSVILDRMADGKTPSSSPMVAVKGSSKQLAALMFTDIVGSVGLQQKLGTEAYTRYVTRHDEIFKECISWVPDARILNETGDGFLVRFQDPSDAVRTALKIQQTLHGESCVGEPIRLRIGLNMGVITEMSESVRGERRSVGMPINIAARVMDLAEAGQILLTRTVYEDARHYVRDYPAAGGQPAGVPRWVSHGDYLFKGGDVPLEIYEIGIEGVSPLRAPEDSAKAWKEGRNAPAASPPQPESSDPLSADDIYLSYSPIDDLPSQVGRTGWISQFQRNLNVRLQQVSGESVNVWRGPIGQGEELDRRTIELLPDVRALVSVVSPPAVKSARCRRELEAFFGSTARRSGSGQSVRMVSAVKHPVPDYDIAPPFDRVMESGHGFEFFDRDPDSGRICQFDESLGEGARQRYQEKIYDLAFELADLIHSGKHGGDASPAEAKGRVYLAPGTTDVQVAYDGIRRELLEDGYEVVPDGRLPLEAGELERSVKEMLQDCDLAIHLVGKNYGVIPENAAASLIELQNRVAAARSRENGLKRIIWMHDDVASADERQLEFVRHLQEDAEAHAGAELVRGNLSAFKELVTARLQPPPAQKTGQAPATSSTASSQIYLICDRADEANAEALEDYLFERGLDVFVPDFDADSDQFAIQHQTNLARCDAVIIYYGAARKAWVDIMLSDMLKATGYGRSAPTEHQAVYLAPPFDRRKERFRTHSVAVARQAGEEFEPSAELIAFVNQVTR